jgi:hypothetical protein
MQFSSCDPQRRINERSQLPPNDRDLHELAEIVRCAIECGGDGNCSVISLFRSGKHGEGEQCYSIVINARRATIRGEFVWIDENLFDDDAKRSEFFDKLVFHLKPLLVGIPELRFIRDEKSDRLIILPASEPRVSCLSHCASPS